MKFRIKVENNQSKSPWWEDYDKDTEDPVKWAKDTIENYNNTLRKYELPRRLLRVEKIEITYTKLWEENASN